MQTETAVPDDPLELVTTEAQIVDAPAERARILELLGNARYLSNVRLNPYDLKTSFIATGQGASNGNWQLEDTSTGGNVYRWTAQGASYSVVNLFRDDVLNSTQPAGTLPLRLAQLRAAIFFAYLGPNYLRSAIIRTAAANYEGKELTCALFSFSKGAASTRGGRRWEESEYCIDQKSGLLVTYSPAPGVYLLYDYSHPLRFNDQTVPGRIVITEAGTTVIEAHLDSLTDPVHLPRELFAPSAGMSVIGTGPLMTPPWHLSRSVSSTLVAGPAGVQPVVVHGMVTPLGQITETEVVQTANSALNATALSVVKSWDMPEQDVPGATPSQHEAFWTIKFVPATR